MREIKTPYVDLIPPVVGEDYEAIKEDIRANGQRVPIDIMEDGTLLDGHTRYRALSDLGIEPKYRIVETDDPLGYSVAVNWHRRQLSTDQKQALVKTLYEQGMSKHAISKLTGVPRSTVIRWLEEEENALSFFLYRLMPLIKRLGLLLEQKPITMDHIIMSGLSPDEIIRQCEIIELTMCEFRAQILKLEAEHSFASPDGPEQAFGSGGDCDQAA